MLGALLAGLAGLIVGAVLGTVGLVVSLGIGLNPTPDKPYSLLRQIGSVILLIGALNCPAWCMMSGALWMLRPPAPVLMLIISLMLLLGLGLWGLMYWLPMLRQNR